MPLEEKKSAGSLVGSLLAVLVLGVAAALFVSVATLYFIGGTPASRAGSLLFSPETLHDITFSDINTLTGGVIKYDFHYVEIHYYDQRVGEWKREKIGLDQYRNFYDLVSRDESLSVVPDEIKQQFETGSPAAVTITLKSANQPASNLKTLRFQEVQFLPLFDYYRVQIHDDEERRNWAYFFHENIYEKLLDAIFPTNTLSLL